MDMVVNQIGLQQGPQNPEETRVVGPTRTTSFEAGSVWRVPGRPTIWITLGQGPTALTVGAVGGGLDIFILIYLFFPLSPSLWETARYRLKYCLKGPLYPNNQPTNRCGVRTRSEGELTETA